MSYQPPNPNGIASSANSAPVVLSTEQEAILNLLATKAKQDLLLAELELKANLNETQPVSVSSLPLPTGAALESTQSAQSTLIGSVTETAPSNDTDSSGLNGRLQRIAQRITSFIGLLPSSLGQKARAASLATTLSSEDITALTPPAAITGFATSVKQSDGTQKTQIVDSDGTAADVIQLGTQLTNTDKGVATNTVIHGYSAGLGGYVDIKATTTGAMVTQSTLIAGSAIIGKVGIDPTENGVTIEGLTYPVSTNNSTSTQLTAGEIYNGTIETIQDQQALQISILTDQPLLVRIISYLDLAGTKIVDDGSAVFFVEKNGKLNKNIQLPADFFRVQIQNQGIATTTTFQCGVTFGVMTSVPSVNLSMPNLGTDEGLPTRSVPQSVFRTTFAKVLASSWDTSFWTKISAGSGMVTSQSSGNGVITTGTTINSETILRSNKAFRGSFRLKEKTILSQRIVNQQFFVEVVDVIGDLDTIVINSATSVTVTIPNNPFTSENVGQSMYLGAYVGTGTFVPGRYAIASVSGNNVNYTVAGFAAGSGTCSVFGWNYHHVIYDTATATSAKYDSQRNGWASGDTTITILTTATGHLLTMKSEDGEADVVDQLVASATTNPVLVRGTRVENICNETTQVWIQIRAVNGTVAPASTTTWTIGMVAMENYSSQPIILNGSRTHGVGTLLPVRVDNTVAISGTVTASNTAGTAAHSAAVSGNPVYTAGKVVPTTTATVDTTLVAGDAEGIPVTTGNQKVIKSFGTAELDVTTVMSTAVTVTTLQQLLPASGTASVRNYVAGLIVYSDAIAVAGNAWILDGQGAIGTSVTIATPGVFTSSAHDLKIGDAIVFTAIGTITGITTNTIYYVTSTSFAATTFTVATTLGGTAIQITGATSAFTFYRVLHAIRLQTTALSDPIVIAFPTPLRGMANVATNLLIPLSLTTGSIYITTNGYRGF